MTKLLLLLLIAGVIATALIWFSAREGWMHRSPYALIDLVETRTPEEKHAFINLATQLAEEAGGSRVLANDAIMPMIVPDERASKADHMTRLLVITQYPTKQAGETAFTRRKEWSCFGDAIRTYAAQPVGRIESLIGRTLPSTLGLFGRESVPASDDAEKLPSLIEAAHILGGEPENGIYEGRWNELLKREGDQPIWMLNFLEFKEEANYADDARDITPSTPIKGAQAYEHYGRGMIGSLAAVGGRVGWSGYASRQLSGTDDGKWHQIVIAIYPSTTAMMTMLALPKYRAAHAHRIAGLARTRLLATQPSEVEPVSGQKLICH